MTINTSNRNYNIKATILLKTPSGNNYKKPSEDIVNWLHIQLKNRHTVFYKIIDPDNSEYDKNFDVMLSFVDDEIVHEVINDQEYDLYRGPEKIGVAKILKK